MFRSISALKGVLMLLLVVAFATAACGSDTVDEAAPAESTDDAAAESDTDADTETTDEEEVELTQEGETIDTVDRSAIAVTNPNTGEVSDELIPQDGSYAVYVEHIRTLNDCDWLGLMAQYPDDAEIHLSDGAVIIGREAIGELFAGFVLPPEEGGLCGLNFVEQHLYEAGGSQNVHWEADADFLFKPYNGSDAYVSNGFYMDAMVTTFEGTDLLILEDADPVTNPNTGEVSDTLVPQDGSYEVYAEHIRVLNDCDWLGLMAQYPNDAEIHLSGGTVVAGREAIGELFAGFVLPPEEGGLCGLTFVEQHLFEAGGSQNVHWEATADFLAEPYNGSDAYVSNGIYMDAMVTTFEGTDLVMAE